MAAAELRLFVGIGVDAETAASLRRLCAGLRLPPSLRPRWIAPANLHLTLSFLGPTEAWRQVLACQAMDRAVAGAAPFAVAAAGWTWLPRGSRPRVLALRLAPEPRLESLQRRLRGTLAARGFVQESRRFLPHLTLARVRGPRPRASLPEPAGLVLPVGALCLFSSRLAATGAEYQVLYRSPLAPT